MRQVGVPPATERMEDVLAPAELIASKVIAYQQRKGHPKSGTDWRDIAMLLLTFPDLKNDPQPVTEQLKVAGANPEVLDAWQVFTQQEFLMPSDDDEYCDTLAKLPSQDSRGGELA